MITLSPGDVPCYMLLEQVQASGLSQLRGVIVGKVMGLKPFPNLPQETDGKCGKGELTFKINIFGWNWWKVTLTLLILLMEELPNNHLGCIKTLSNHGFFLPTSTGESWISAINPSTVAPSFWRMRPGPSCHWEGRGHHQGASPGWDAQTRISEIAHWKTLVFPWFLSRNTHGVFESYGITPQMILKLKKGYPG